MAGRNILGLRQLYLQMPCKRRNSEAIFRRCASTSSQVHENCETSLLKKMKSKIREESDNVCIYRVPEKMRRVEAEAYHPSIVSIGPYHRGDQHLKEMEELKLNFFHSIFKPEQGRPPELKRVISAMEELEPEARSCYAEDVKLSRDEFVEMMIIDGCFVLQLLREVGTKHLREVGGQRSPSLIRRWMLPTLRRDLIKLENQLPISIIQELFDLIPDGSHSECSKLSLQNLALKFFKPLLRDSNADAAGATTMTNARKEEIKNCHFLNLFRSSILPEVRDRKRQERMIQPVTNLREAGVIFQKSESDRALDIQSEGSMLRILPPRLKIPPLHIDDHKATLFRNMVAFEQLHKKCEPDVTAYLFFFNGLVNSADDVGILHYQGIVHHCLGCYKEAADLVNSLCKEVEWDGEDSYLHKVVCEDIENYLKGRGAKLRAHLVHHYFSSWAVGISTVAGLFALYLTLVQTGWSIVGKKEVQGGSFLLYLRKAIFPSLAPPRAFEQVTKFEDMQISC